MLWAPWDVNKLYSKYLTRCKKKQGQKQLRNKLTGNDVQIIAAQTGTTLKNLISTLGEHCKVVNVYLDLSAINQLSHSCTKTSKHLLEQIFIVHHSKLQL